MNLYNGIMRSLFFLLAGSILLMLGCVDRPEVSRSAYGTILEALPDLQAAKEPFPFPLDTREELPSGTTRDHQGCVFNEEDFW